MTSTTAFEPAVCGGPPAFPEGLPLVRAGLGDADRAQVLDRIDDALRSGMLTTGRYVRELEEAAAARLGVDHAIAVASCTLGLMLALKAAGVDAGDVAVPSFTFSATAHVVRWAGAEPKWCDVDASTFTLDPADVRRRGRPGAILATHVYGTPCAVDDLAALAAEWDVPLLYDAAHAMGSTAAGRRCGGFGRAEVFSMTPTKVITSGEGGIVATNDADVAEYIRMGRDYGHPGDYDCRFAGINARMSELHAAVGLTTLADLDRRLVLRRERAAQLHARLGGVDGITFPTVRDGDESTFKDVTIVVDPVAFGLGAGQLSAALKAEGVDSRRYYHPAVHRQQAYAHMPPVELPVTDSISPRVLAVPMWADMAPADMDRLGRLVIDLHEAAPRVRAALEEDAA